MSVIRVNAIKEAREAAYMFIEDVADYFSTDIETIQNWENDSSTLKWGYQLESLSLLYGVSLDFLLDRPLRDTSNKDITEEWVMYLRELFKDSSFLNKRALSHHILNVRSLEYIKSLIPEDCTHNRFIFNIKWPNTAFSVLDYQHPKLGTIVVHHTRELDLDHKLPWQFLKMVLQLIKQDTITIRKGANLLGISDIELEKYYLKN